MQIRVAMPADFDAMWPIFEAVVAAGDSYVFDETTTRDEAHAYWFGPGIASFVALDGEELLGMYKLVANQRGRGAHVANASFMVSPRAHGKGIGKTMGVHALEAARHAGFLAMQFNFVVSTNTAAVTLWQQLGFAIVGTLPGAFRHAQRGFVDAYGMFRTL